MRQLHAQPASRLVRDLAEAGLTQDNAGWMAEYLDMSQPEKPELLARAQRQDPDALGDAERRKFAQKLSFWLDQKDEALKTRAFQAAYAVFGPVLSSLFRHWYALGIWGRLSRDRRFLEQALGPQAALALAANYWGHGGSECAQELRCAGTEQLEAAMELFPREEDPARIVLNCLWLAKQKPKGLLRTLFAGDGKTVQTAQAVQRGVIANLPELAPRLTPASHGHLAAYIRQGKDGPLPASPKNPSYHASAHMDPAGIGSACFWAMEAAPQLQAAFLVCVGTNAPYVLRRTLDLAGEERFMDRVPWLIAHTDFVTVLSNLAASYPELSGKLVRQYPDLFEKAARTADLRSAKALMELVQKEDPALARQILTANKSYVQRSAAMGICSNLGAEQPGFLQFIHTGSGLDALLKKHPIGAGSVWNYANASAAYAESYGTDPFMARCLIAGAMLQSPYCFSNLWRAACKGLPGGQDTAGALLDLVVQQGLSPLDSLYLAEHASRGCVAVEQGELAQWLLEQPEEVLREALEKGSAYIRCTGIQALAKKGDFGAVTALAGDSSKQVRAAVVEALTRQPNGWGPKGALLLLGAKKAAQREAALDLIARLDRQSCETGSFSQKFRPQLEEALAKEKSQKLANAIRALLGMSIEEGAGAATPTGDPVALALKGGKKRKLQWVLDGAPLPAALEEDRTAAVMVSCQAGDLPAARSLAGALDAKELRAYAHAVFDLWLEQKAPSKQKWVLTFASLFGGREMVDTLKRQITQWPQEARGAIACDGVYALALSPEPEALLLVDSISRKFKFKQVKTAAGKALDYAAKELGLTPEELADRIVPDLGLDQRGHRSFDYGPRRFDVSLTPALELEVRTQEGKKLKTMPAPGKQDDPELAGEASAQFKALKKQIKATAATQALRLEQALSTGRTWTGEGWKGLFVQKPVMRQFAVGLVWGVYEEGRLSATFRYLEDGSLNTAQEDEYALPEKAQVGLVHPVELSPEELSAWKQQLEDYEIRQPIPQLERPVYRLDPELAGETSLERFGGKVLNGLSLSGKLLGQGWYRGSVQDAGVYYDFYREDGGVGAQLNFSGMWAGGEDEEVEVQDVQFYRAGAVRRGSYVYDTPKGDSLIPLGQVSARMYSEIIYQVEKATASSTETREDWKSRK